MNSAPLDRPLGDAELDELRALLVRLSPEGKGMDLSTLDGFLAALMAGPRTFLPSEWMPWIRDPVEGLAEPAFSDAHEAGRFYQLLMTHMNSISRALREGPAAYAPLLYLVTPAEMCEVLPLSDFQPGSGNDDALVWSPIDWCAGFLAGVEMDMEGWDPFMHEHAEGFGLIVTFGSDEGLEDLAGRPPSIEAVSGVARVLGSIACQAHDFFLPLRAGASGGGPTREPYRRPERVGRNEACPCGSGRKFKHCHGARGGLN